MFTVHPVGAAAGGDCFLLKTGRGAALIDTGFSYCGALMADNVAAALGDEKLQAILLTHSHYDHASGTAAILARWPDVKVYAGKYAAYVFTRPSALKLMLEMNENAANVGGRPGADCSLGDLHADVALADGDTFTVGGLTFTALETPGHTKCCTSYWCESEGLLIAAETIGLQAKPGIAKPTYLVGYRMTLASIRRALALSPRYILRSHTGLIEGENACEEFLINSLYWAQELRRRVIAGYKAGKSVETLVEEWLQFFAENGSEPWHIEKAARLNASITIPMLIKEYEAEQ